MIKERLKKKNALKRFVRLLSTNSKYFQPILISGLDRKTSDNGGI